MSKSAEAKLDTGEPARLVAFANNVLSFVAPKALPPGSPVGLLWSSHALQGRSIGSKRQDGDQFAVRLRMVSLTREQRDALQESSEQW